MEYTKGEWDAFKWTDGHGYNIFSDRGFIASVPLSETPHTMVETEANAQLIAAAPHMYEALKRVFSRQVIENGRVVERGMPSSEEIIEIQKVLAKAEGKS